MKDKKVRLIAFYLPQFHPIKENNEWWGKGFTEWTNVGKAKPLFKGHYQPRVPADLGYYDLRIPEVRIEQANMAREAGIEGFCYWHYWFGNGKRLLERPFNEVLKSKEPNFPFCLGWANETWSGIWHGVKNKILIEQTYPGIDDYRAHFYSVLDAFKDNRYIRVNNRPIFYIYKPLLFEDVSRFIQFWQDLAVENGLDGIYFVGQILDIKDKKRVLEYGFNSVSFLQLDRVMYEKITFFQRLMSKLFGRLKVYEYKDAYPYFFNDEMKKNDCIPNIIPNWDHSPRSNGRNMILHNSTPELFSKHLEMVYNNIQDKPEQLRIAFVKSWNEWGEGNYLEPDLKFGKQYLEVLREANK